MDGGTSRFLRAPSTRPLRGQALRAGERRGRGRRSRARKLTRRGSGLARRALRVHPHPQHLDGSSLQGGVPSGGGKVFSKRQSSVIIRIMEVTSCLLNASLKRSSNSRDIVLSSFSPGHSLCVSHIVFHDLRVPIYPTPPLTSHKPLHRNISHQYKPFSSAAHLAGTTDFRAGALTAH